MKHVRLATACLVGLLGPAQARPADTLQQLGRALELCLGGTRGLQGSEITVVFSLRRDGSLLGKPRVSYSRLPGDLGDQKRFVASVAQALDGCLPVPITDALGGAIAGRPFAIRLVIPRSDTPA
ncbi:hypothetical protein [Labrys wisconsinensis]|uniref:TonB C-terminal domain-containing protein n=1 Tax=Labrys wisconsinensis TaxID=425677 RepID=A0ABU0J7V2_9HYPH|nr:hypothetical protein [Labrys wisconsinensis]MDQ0469680.1 hypothetical protein [Labrys wisconsinensis]